MEEGRGVAEGGESRLEGCSSRPQAPRARLRARRCRGETEAQTWLKGPFITL